ncbi:FCD domain-containing protein [Gimesia sp.]|uniref:FCD domain-containing protein n=1 Tax=Gimesia sp. TaxID=2024833 RepID=UPI003A94C57E
MEIVGSIKRGKKYQEVLDLIVSRIQKRELAVGDILPSERELMQSFGVGRPAIRQALSTLERMGMIEIQQGGVSRVSMPTPEQILGQISDAAQQLLLNSEEGARHLRESRGAIELVIIQTAIERATDDEIEKIRDALNANRLALEAGDSRRFVQTDIKFHVAIAEATHNPIYKAMVASILGMIMDYRDLVVVGGIDQKSAYAEHEALFKCIEERDFVGAEQAFRAHLQRIGSVLDQHYIDLRTSDKPNAGR